MNNATFNTILSESNFEFDGDLFWVSPNGEVLVALDADRDGEERRALFCDSEGRPFGAVAEADLAALLRRVDSEDQLGWLAEWGHDVGYDVIRC